MKYNRLFSLGLVLCMSLACDTAIATNEALNAQTDTLAQSLLSKMTLEEKIGQKLMLDFRYWCDEPQSDSSLCKNDMIVINDTIKKIVAGDHADINHPTPAVGGVILFANNLKTIPQIVTLTDAFQKTMSDTNNLPLLIGTDQEGGIVSRLPASETVTFAGNMAMTAGHSLHKADVSSIANTIGINLKAVGINLDFAPDVDVNSNPKNPIINVRSFSDDPAVVAELGGQFTDALQKTGIAATIKHFPGHGDTSTDSHTLLPTVSHTLDQANTLDLYPFKEIIKNNAPYFIMTAHIQFPALDDTKITTKNAEEIIVPSTLSRKIQTDLLRNQIGYQGILITDALNMGAIAQNFEPADAVIKTFQAGVDIALMPIPITNPNDVPKWADLINKIKIAVNDGVLSKEELDQSVLRILKVKLKLGLLQPDAIPLQKKIENAQAILNDPAEKKLESTTADAAVTLIQNNNSILPLTAVSGMRIHILMPLLEQAAGIKQTIIELQRLNQLPPNIVVTISKISETTLMAERAAVDDADIIIVGNSSTMAQSSSDLKAHIPTVMTSNLFSLLPLGQTSMAFPIIPEGDGNDRVDTNGKPNQTLFSAGYITRSPTSLFVTPDTYEPQFVYQILKYGKQHSKKTIFISLRAPYDLANYTNVADAMLAVYNFYGYLEVNGPGYYRGPMMPALTRVLFGISKPEGVLPVDVPDPDNSSKIIYYRAT